MLNRHVWHEFPHRTRDFGWNQVLQFEALRLEMMVLWHDLKGLESHPLDAGSAHETKIAITSHYVYCVIHQCPYDPHWS